MKERSKSRRLLSRRKALALPRAGNSMLVRLMRGRMIRRGLQVTTARDRRANRALAHSGDPIHADPIRADRSPAALNSADLTLGRRADRIVAALRRSANSSTRDRRFWFKSPKNRSPKKARESLLT
jgi:hypothetical protein